MVFGEHIEQFEVRKIDSFYVNKEQCNFAHQNSVQASQLEVIQVCFTLVGNTFNEPSTIVIPFIKQKKTVFMFCAGFYKHVSSVLKKTFPTA